MTSERFNELTKEIIEAFYHVYNSLGFGFLESVYQNALYFELKKKGFKVETEKCIDVHYEGQIVGKFKADMLVNDKVILELKAVQLLADEHEMQLMNYLKATDIEIGLLLNFGRKAQIKRKIYNNEYKKYKNLCEVES
ncbi:MAG: GxxExxY protein [Oscillospiraceae bacterium]|nr:GxxExxY protein [Oscillospiraceae bacterium]